jgi:hypothetical protein
MAAFNVSSANAGRLKLQAKMALINNRFMALSLCNVGGGYKVDCKTR